MERHKPDSNNAKPACINITKKPAINTQTILIENRLWAMRSYRSLTVNAPGTSRLPFPEGLAATPADWPVGSGQAGFAGTVFIAGEYDGEFGGDAAAADMSGVKTCSGFAAQVAVFWENRTTRTANSIGNLKHILVHISIVISFAMAKG